MAEKSINSVFPEMFKGLFNYKLWSRLGFQEIKRRYRRTVIGPFWTTISLGIFIITMGFLWAHLWKIDLKEFLPYLTSGMIVWIMISTTIVEGCETFTSPSPKYLIENLNFPYIIIPCAVVWRNIIVFFHNMIIFFIVAIYSRIPINIELLLIIPGFILLFVNSVWVATLLGFVCARYRDIRQVIVSLLQVVLFITPIFWSVEQVENRLIAFVDYNIFYHFIELIRAPLLGKLISETTLVIILFITFIGVLSTGFIYIKFRNKLPYWL